MKRIAILGSTGSIGINSLRVIDNLGSNFVPFALTCNSGVETIAKQAMRYRPAVVVIVDTNKKVILEDKLKGSGIKVLAGKQSLCEIVEMEEVDTIINGIMGSAGFPPTLVAIRKGKMVALANKETLVSYGEIVMKEAKENKAQIIPVDSEHSAIFQCMHGRNNKEIRKIILTASGGPFKDRENLHDVTVEEAINHPVWKMGKKISIDSATMINKSLEIIEAHFLFGIPGEKISTVIHPQCIIHSAVEFVDGSVIAQLSNPDMTLPIQYALTFPERRTSITEFLDLEKISTLTFEPATTSRFPALGLAYLSLKKGGTTTAVFNASNEYLVRKFLNEKISLDKIIEIISKILDEYTPINSPSIKDIEDAEKWAKHKAEEYVNSINEKMRN
jgi:1-deoxy-D-xylulose-5-phosphate reductoisomerase